MRVICLSAKAQHGKDTTAIILKDIFEKKGYKVLITHFADLLKYICTQFFNWNGKKDIEGRSLLQKIGTDVVGKKDSNFWVDFLIKILKFFDNTWDVVLIPDCRFPQEVELLKQNFDTKIFRIIRPNFDNGLTIEQKNHISETALDNYKFDLIIENTGTTEDLKNKLLTLIGKI